MRFEPDFCRDSYMRILLILALGLQSGLLFSQFVTVNNGRYGLIDMDGAPILNNEWDKVELISEEGNIYRYDLNGLSGVYIHGKQLALPCRYAITFLSDAAFSLCSNGKCGLLAGASNKNGLWEYQWTGELWDELYEINSRFAGVLDNSKYGVLSFSGTAVDTVVSIEFASPVFRSNKLGFHRYDENGNVILHAPGSSGKYDVTTTTGTNDPRIHGNLVYYVNETQDSLICMDYRSGRRLQSYLRDPQMGTMVTYDEDWQCIYRMAPAGKRNNLIELINPYTGELIVSEVVKRNSIIRFEADPTARAMDQSAIVMLCDYKNNRNVYTLIGEIQDYAFTPYETRTVRVEKFSPGETRAPFFMPGRDK